MEIVARNVNEALYKAVLCMKQGGVARDSRNGPVLEYPTPVLTTYLRPWERVLFNVERDANPFFHFMEGLWILAGRDDVDWICRYNKKLADYSDDGHTFHGAYGYRMRFVALADQLNTAIEMLRANHDDRRVVVQIWNADLDLGEPLKDIPCNTQLYFKIRNDVLHMTVTCRSNDIIWGAYGANAVHFSMVQQYVADFVGVQCGPMHQLSDSWHVYTQLYPNDLWARVQGSVAHTDDLYDRADFIQANMPRVAERPEVFDIELYNFMNGILSDLTRAEWQNPIFPDLAIPMAVAWNAYKDGNIPWAIKHVYENINAVDWRMACRDWLKRRLHRA